MKYTHFSKVYMLEMYGDGTCNEKPQTEEKLTWESGKYT
jgi:hypothetical protein